MTGYLHPDYAQSLSEFGEPPQLQKSGGWLLKLRVDGTQSDAVITYNHERFIAQATASVLAQRVNLTTKSSSERTARRTERAQWKRTFLLRF